MMSDALSARGFFNLIQPLLCCTYNIVSPLRSFSGHWCRPFNIKQVAHALLQSTSCGCDLAHVELHSVKLIKQIQNILWTAQDLKQLRIKRLACAAAVPAGKGIAVFVYAGAIAPCAIDRPVSSLSCFP